MTDAVNHPPHYASPTENIIGECIDYTQDMDFLLGNAFKYVWRAGNKNPAAFYEDINKALWYLNRAQHNHYSASPSSVTTLYTTLRSSILGEIRLARPDSTIELLMDATPNNLDVEI